MYREDQLLAELESQLIYGDLNALIDMVQLNVHQVNWVSEAIPLLYRARMHAIYAVQRYSDPIHLEVLQKIDGAHKTYFDAITKPPKPVLMNDDTPRPFLHFL